ncbi:MAG: hypothetical protein ABIP29_11985, partial [Candidatus Eisenbacteria bacterium]
GDREAALRACARLAAAAEDPIAGALLVEEAGRVLAFDVAALGREVEGLRGRGTGMRPVVTGPPVPAPARVAVRPEGVGSAPSRAVRASEERFVELLVAHPELLEEASAEFAPAWFHGAETGALAAALLGPERREAQAILADPDLAAPARELLSRMLMAPVRVAHPEQELAERMERLRRREREERQRVLQQEFVRLLGTPGAEERVKELQRELQDTAAVSRDRQLSSEARRKETA